MNLRSKDRIRNHTAATLLALVLLGGLWTAVAQTAQKLTTPDAQTIVAFLNQTIAWYRHLSVEQQLATESNEPTDVVFLRDDRQLADQIVRLSFDFARTEAELMAKARALQPAAEASDQATAPYQSLVNLGARADQQVKRSQTELDSLRRQLDSASGRRRQTLQSAIDETRSELELAQTRRDVLRNMLDFIAGASSSGAGPGGLLSQIQELERAVPAAAKPAPGQNAPGENGTSAAVLPANRKPAPSGILALISDLVALSRKMHTLDESIQLTDGLAQASKDLRSPLGASLRELAQRGDQLANEPPATDPKTLAQQKAELDTLTTQFKLGSDAVLPLVKQRILLDLYKRNLVNWRNSIKTQYTAELKSLVVRLAVLALVLAAVIGASQLWRKALYRYVQDARRRYQLLLVRRIVLWFVVAVIIAFAFATELGSLATFAGLLTAGVAVALQNVILSIAGYFFLIGKYGVRVGDRVQISGVTGEVVDIGLVRLHLMEVGTGGTDAQPTGRVVVFSNSVVFQPTGGFFKQIPGTNFVWHEITLTMAPESNYRAVEERLMGAVETVFAQYREQIEGQRRHIERTLGPVSLKTLGPQSRLRLAQSGLEVVIRYPVELDTAAKIDDRITREVLDAIEREPKLKLVGSGIPNIQEVRGETVGSAKP